MSSGLRQWKTLIEKQTDKSIKHLRTDNGLEFCSEEFNKFCKEEGIVRHHTCVRRPQQNGVAERYNRTILERTRCMLFVAGLDRDFWAEAASTACYLINRSPHSGIDLKTPKEMWSSTPPDYSQLKIFGCSAYAHVREGKLDPRSKKYIFLGYGTQNGVKGFRLWSPDESKTIHNRDVIFDEKALLKEKENLSPSIVDISSGMSEKVEFEVEPNSFFNPPMPTTGDEEPKSHIVQSYSLARDRERRIIRPPSRFSEADFVAFALSVAEETLLFSEPCFYSEEISREDSANWMMIM